MKRLFVFLILFGAYSLVSEAQAPGDPRLARLFPSATAFSPKEGVDAVWPGDGLIYSQRLSAQRTKSLLNRIASSPHYKSMTIRSWQTTLALMDLVKAVDEGDASAGSR